MRYFGKLGIAQQVEKSPGVWDEVITEVDAIGTIKQRTDTLQLEGTINIVHKTTTSVSVPARGVGPRDNSDIRYVTHVGKRWVASSVVDEYPQIVIFFGEEYHGPIPG